jgi:uroporphyrin-III C-methyltransferase/precorrin-2 dehydrogenase/sirohydrochlorin ferrochelatase
MQYLPIGIDLKNKPCLVVGGGKIAARKIQRLLDAGATVSVVSVDICDEIADLSKTHKLTLKYAHYEATDMHEAYLVVAATNDSVVNKAIALGAQQQNILCNAAESAEAGSVIFPSLINRNPVVISVSSDGASPVFASMLSAQIEAFVPQYIAKLAVISAQYRAEVKARFDSIAQRRRFWSNVMTGKVTQLLKANKDEAAKAEISRLLNQEQTDEASEGEVYLVGAGPGDPDLLTLGALRLMQRAEIILHDRLVSDEVLALCPSDAEYVYVGKERSSHAMRQQRINQRLVDYAQQGKRVLRLKGGDPFIFGRGGEEIETLADQGVKYHLHIVTMLNRVCL